MNLPALQMTSLKTQVARNVLLRAVGFYLLGLLIAISIVFGSLVSFHNRQINVWLTSFPKTILPHLIEADYFSVRNKAQLMISTKLFKSLVVQDRTSSVIFSSDNNSQNLKLLPINDEAGVFWGSFGFEPSYTFLLSIAIASIAATLLLMLGLVFSLKKSLLNGISIGLKGFEDLIERLENLSLQLEESDLKNYSFDHISVTADEQKIDSVIAKLISAIRKSKFELERLTIEAQSRSHAEKIYKVAKQVAHDIRSPLTALNAIASRLPHDSDELRLLKVVSERINRIAEDLLGKAKSESNDILTNIDECLNQIVDEIRLSLPSTKNISITSTVEAYNIVRPINRTIIMRIFSIILTNAIEAIDKSGTIDIRIADKGEKVEISFFDSGAGIESHHLNMLGNPGFTHGKKTGNGMGLSYVKTNIQQVGGEVRFISKPGNGTKVVVEL